jgi:hypothetical protein
MSHMLPTWPSFEKLQARLEQWQRQFPTLMQLEVLGKSAQRRPIFAAQLTDSTVPDEIKEHVLITAQHSGIERSGTTGVFYLMDWLLSGDPSTMLRVAPSTSRGDPLAREILRRQVIVCMPVVNPDGYVAGTHVNTQKLDPYTAWTLEGPKEPEKQPEALAVQRMMDKYQPEVHADFHGNNMAFHGYIHVENSGASYSNLALRPYRHEIMRLMDEAALTEGYPSDQAEQDAERIFWGPELEKVSEKTWLGRPRVYAAIYCYNRYHTLPLASEVAWERSGFLRHRRLLQIGNETWPGEYYAGYPTRVIMRNSFHMVTAYGQTAAARRRSRVELWNKQRQITHGMSNPQVEGLAFYVCATTTAAAKRWLADSTLKGFAAKIAEHPCVNAAFIRRVLEGHPDGPGQWGPQACLWLEGGGLRPEQDAPIENGISLRLRIPYSQARITELHMNGCPIARSETDGYLTWVGQGFTYIQINIPPAKSSAEDFFIVTCRYDPGEKRTQGYGW